mmetsp:Transcript_30170/g.82937  ORF Transcript_30170/g.82937 Transcript_30170/m.82937 type:complete len:114 (+) Transcript_30170:99-440(+)
MGLLQMLVDVWASSTCYALARRSGIVQRPSLQALRHPTARLWLSRYFQLGEQSLDQIETCQRALQEFRARRGMQGGGTVGRGVLQRAKPSLQQLRLQTEKSLRRLADRLRDGR